MSVELCEQRIKGVSIMYIYISIQFATCHCTLCVTVVQVDVHGE
jgi:hypothetical protein